MPPPSRAFPKNWPNATAQLAQGCEHITLIFDKGNNSQEAFQTLDNSPFHFVGSLVPSQHPDLLRIPLKDFQPLAGQRLASCLAYRTTKQVFGQERTIVITYNENLLEGQLQGIQASLTKAWRQVRGSPSQPAPAARRAA